MEEPVKLTFKEQWQQRKWVKRSKKKAKKELMKNGYDRSTASSMVKKAIRNIVSKPERKAAGRGN